MIDVALHTEEVGAAIRVDGGTEISMTTRTDTDFFSK